MNVLAHPTAPTARSIRFTTIGAICDQFGGEVQTGPFGSQLHASDYSAEGTPVVMPQDMVDGRIVTAKIARVSQEHVARLPQHRLQAGDIVYSRRGDVSRFAIVTEAEGGWLCGTGSIRVRLNSPDFDTRYLRRFLQQDSVRSWLENEAKGVTMLNLNTSIIRNLPIAFPPLAEQRRIAAILDQADALRAKRRQTLTQLDEMARAIFVDMFGDPATNPKGWPVSTIADLLDSAAYGTSEKASGEGETPILRMNNITYGGSLDLRDLKYITLSRKDFERFTVQRGDLLFNRTNSPDLVGKTAVFDGKSPMAFAGYLIRLRANRDAAPQYLSGFLNSPHGKALLRNMCKTIIGMANINAKEVQRIVLPRPPRKLQDEYAEALHSIAVIKESHHYSATKLDTLFASLQHRAFRGEL